MLFLLRLIGRAVVTLVIAYTLTFFALRLLPGDAVSSLLLDSGGDNASIQARRDQLGLNAPMIDQYLLSFRRLLAGDLGYSLLDALPVSEKIAAHAAATITLAGSALAVASVIGITGGIAATIGSPMVRRVTRAALTIILSMPVYWIGTLVLVVFGGWLRLLPTLGADRPGALIAPALTLGLSGAGVIARVTQTELARVRAQPYSVTAWAKGLSRTRIIIVHQLKPALPAVITVIALQAGYFLAGTVIVETVFNRSGIGRMLIDSVLRQDYPVVQGIVLWSAAVFVGADVIANSLVMWIDPRSATAQ